VVLPWALGAIFLIHGWKVDKEIAARQQTTQGVITAHEPANHNRYGYTFFVNGKIFNGWESPMKRELSVGQDVTVYYDPQDPNKNALTDFAELGLSNLGPLPVVFFGIGLLAWYIGWQRRRHKMSPARPTSVQS
jgi:Protein of unknown function (DUF3592)